MEIHKENGLVIYNMEIDLRIRLVIYNIEIYLINQACNFQHGNSSLKN